MLIPHKSTQNYEFILKQPRKFYVKKKKKSFF